MSPYLGLILERNVVVRSTVLLTCTLILINNRFHSHLGGISSIGYLVSP